MSKWTRRFHPQEKPRARLVCFPHAGGSASAYHPLSTGLSELGLETLAVQYPGRQERYREPCFEQVDALVDAVLEELSPTLGDGIPFGLFGHSMGSVLAFETARRLEKEDQGPVALFVSGGRAPSLPWPPPGTPSAREVDDAALTEDLRLLSDGDAEILRYPALLRLALPALRADYLMLEKYEYVTGKKLNCPIMALAGDRDPRIAVDTVTPWEQETLDEFEMKVLSGGHFFIQDHLPQVLSTINARF